MKVSIIGLGWFGWPLGERLLAQHDVSGTTTSPDKLSKKSGIKTFLLTLNPELETANSAEIFDADCLVINIPPKRLGSDTATYYKAQMEALLSAVQERTGHIIFVSSTGVFGDHQERVDEDTFPEPTSDSGEALVNAETYLQSAFSGRVSIIRPGGLVGEDRHPAPFLAGRKGISGKLHPVNLVHREDLISLTQFLIENKSNRKIFHAVAELHPAKQTYYTQAAIAMGLSVPEFDESDTSPGKFVYGTKTQIETRIHFKYNNPYDMY